MKSNRLVISSIIVCEDDEDDRYLLNDVSQDFNPKLKVEFLSNGVLLMDLLKHYVPDLIFLDLDMPYKNGLECLFEIRGNPGLENLPVIMFSSTTRAANMQTAYDLGARPFLIKSPAFAEYASSIQAVLKLDWSKPDAIKAQYCVNGRYTEFT